MVSRICSHTVYDCFCINEAERSGAAGSKIFTVKLLTKAVCVNLCFMQDILGKRSTMPSCHCHLSLVSFSQDSAVGKIWNILSLCSVFLHH